MQFRKLFSSNDEQSLRPRHRLGEEYLEGRGLYPERRNDVADRQHVEHQYDEWLDDPVASERHEQLDHWHSDRRPVRRRMPLTTLEALLQIKENGLAHENA